MPAVHARGLKMYMRRPFGQFAIGYLSRRPGSADIRARGNRRGVEMKRDFTSASAVAGIGTASSMGGDRRASYRKCTTTRAL